MAGCCERSINWTVEQLAGLHGLWIHCWGMNRPAWLFAQVMSFRRSSQVSGKGSLRFWSTAQDFVLNFFSFKHWLCGDPSQQSSLSSKSSDYRILHLQHRGQDTVGEVLGHFSLSLRKHLAGTEENDIPAWPLSHSPAFLSSCQLLAFPHRASCLLLQTGCWSSMLLQFYEVNFLRG